ncbi:MAG: hypothetical protein HOP10_00715 [Chitinophagaceae bacterium]|nr:hypothetical protein [Chitinophagaceae bacterium]
MPDNPRGQDNTDIPSSRSSAGMPHAAGSSHGGGYTPPPPAHSGSSPRVKNIIIGSIVTIATSTIVFLITQNLKKPDVDVKQKTTAAWNSYVGYENIYTSNVMSLSKDSSLTSFDAILKAFRTESEKFQRDVSDLADEKNIDKDLKKVLLRRLENERASLPVLEAYYTNMKKIDTADMTMKERVTATADEMSRYNEHVKGLSERAVNDIKGIAEVLSKRYDQKFLMSDFLIIEMSPKFIKTTDSMVNVLRSIEFDSNGNLLTEQVIIIKEKDIIGNWNADGAVFTFEKNGKMAWVIGGGQKATGTWKIEDNKLRLDGSINNSTKGYWLFNVTEVSENSLFLESVKDENIYYSLVRIITQ